jgi:hypothetical protein
LQLRSVVLASKHFTYTLDTNYTWQAVAAPFRKPLTCGQGNNNHNNKDNKDEGKDKLDNERNGDENNGASGGVAQAKEVRII